MESDFLETECFSIKNTNDSSSVLDVSLLSIDRVVITSYRDQCSLFSAIETVLVYTAPSNMAGLLLLPEYTDSKASSCEDDGLNAHLKLLVNISTFHQLDYLLLQKPFVTRIPLN